MLRQPGDRRFDAGYRDDGPWARGRIGVHEGALGPRGLAPFIQAYREHFFAPELQTARLYEHAAEVIEELAARGFLLAVATGKSRPGLDRELESTGLARFLSGSRTADETHSKPHPAMLLELMEELAVGPEATLMVGDTEWDLEMARRAGVGAVAACYGAHPRERLDPYSPLACIEAVDALLGLLERPGTSASLPATAWR